MLTVEQKADVRAHWMAGETISHIARVLGLTREYVQTYVKGLNRENS